MQRIPFLGERVSVAVGVPNPWMLFGQLGLVLLLIFVADAARTVWRRRPGGCASSRCIRPQPHRRI